MKKKYLILLLILIGGFFVFNTAVLATEIIPDAGNTSQTSKYRTGDYEINDLVQVGVNIATFILGITGSLALLFFVYGGVMFLISGGSQDKVNKGKTIIINAIIGIVIVFTSFMIIKFALQALGCPDWNGGLFNPQTACNKDVSVKVNRPH